MMARVTILTGGGMSQADEIRAYANRAFIQSARKAGRQEVVIEARDVHKDLHLERRMPAVCSALDARKFEDEYGVLLIRRTGPSQSSTVTWTFSIKS